ncbi:putative inactive cadmium/zinc-transporting ATPase HMA3 isoform X1 [Chenopodium quinoa]|uniref:putative inactive cadmium/zinc-transporting ATPase HMA3 isoform X1 n=2 Tax=Chenopodium quinoa TaxID=63459 RepID=UPI000B770CB4|nr:putative inactive cadmium/zinc-transporting ATPase HMA3 isoform X1 [Chenopodium quinoa]
MSTHDLEQPLIPSTQLQQTPNLQEHTIQEEDVKLEKSYFEIMGLCCSSEVPLIESIVKPLNGVKDISVVVPTKTLTVVHDIRIISPSQIVQALNQARLEASVRPRGEGNYTKKWPGKWNITCGVLLLLSLLKYVYQPMQWLAIVAVLIGVPNIIWRSIASIRNLTLNINVIVLIAVGGTIALQDYTDAAIIVFLYNIAQWLESRASYKAMSVMSSLTSMTPLKATLADSGKQVDVTSVNLGTIIAVKAGEVIPIDGVVVEGKSEVDEKALTGESFPVIKEIGSTAFAGTINLNGYIGVRTTMLAENCLVARMVNLVEEAQSRKARIQTFIENCTKWYIPVVVLISAGVAVTPIVLQSSDKTRWFHLALVVLVSACPCALVISTPVTIFCALSKAATAGLLFKGGDYLELLAKVKTVAFDKTGTITTGEFAVTHFQSLHEKVSIEKLLFWISSIESKSSHPMAAALVNYAASHSIKPIPEMVEEFQNYPGEGIYGKIEGEHIYIGNYRISLRAGFTEKCDNDELQKMEEKASGFIYMGATLVGTFALSDNCRSGVMEAIKELKESGIRTVMLTGDNHAAAQQVQYQLEDALDIVHAQLLPEDKAKIIEELKKDGVVAMVGDGINDALALATTDIGISMGISGSALAMETGHVILMSNDIRKIPEAIRISKKASRKIVENVIISFSTKGLVLALAIAGYSMLLVAVVTDVGTCLLVILNSMLLLRGADEYKKPSAKIVQNKSCCDKTAKGEVKCQSSVSKKAIQPSIEKAEEPKKGCCAKKTCTAKLEGTLEKKDSAIKVGCCKRSASNCRTGKCKSSTGCTQVGASSSLDVVIV